MSVGYTPELFDIENDNAWKEHLDREGYVVLRNILSSEKKQECFNTFKRDWNKVTPNFNFEDKTTWNIKNCPLMFGKGMAVYKGFGQSNFMWSLRTDSNIKSIFEKIFNERELVCSMDGFSVFVSKEQKSKPWLHIDQNPSNTLYSIQGAYNFMPVQSVNDAGFVLVPQSHKTYNPVVNHTKDWIVVDSNDEHLSQSVKLLIPENCFTLWNSKLIHSNEGMNKQEIELNRLTCYITYLPKSFRSLSILEKRKEAYKKSETTSHWANKCEIKRYPFGFKKRFESRGYSSIQPELENDGSIPIERLEML